VFVAVRGADDGLRVIEAAVHFDEVAASWAESILLKKRVAPELIKLTDRLPHGVCGRQFAKTHLNENRPSHHHLGVAARPVLAPPLADELRVCHVPGQH
jgi:hypothetical protein